MRTILPSVLRVAVPFLTAVVFLFSTSACSATSGNSEPSNQQLTTLPAASGNALEASEWGLPVNGQLDYQLGGSYTPEDTVQIVVRDRESPPVAGTYSICYVNAFQTQPGEEDMWSENLLLEGDGEVFHDPNWPDEAIADTSTTQKREEFLALTVPWIEQCATDGYQGVEFDNLDSYTRSFGLLSFESNLALAQGLVEAAHANGLTAGQKNTAEYSEALHESAGFDFALTESCAYYGECGDYVAVYGSYVLDVEYSDEMTTEEFQTLCEDPDSPNGMVLRDRDLAEPGDPAYVFATC